MSARVPLLPLAVLAALLVATACRPVPDTPLTRAASEGRVDEIEALVASGARVNEPGGGMTPLIWAARSGQVGAVRTLVRLGAHVEGRGGVNGWTPLQHALHTGQGGAARALIDAGADVSGRTGAAALSMAAGYANVELVELLLARGADPHVVLDPDGSAEDILTNAVGGAWDIDYRWRGCAAHTAVVQALLDAAPDLKLPDNYWGRSALSYARRQGCADMIALLERHAATSLVANRR